MFFFVSFSADPKRDVPGADVSSARGGRVCPTAQHRRAGAGLAPAGRRAQLAHPAALRRGPRLILHAHGGQLALIVSRRECYLC